MSFVQSASAEVSLISGQTTTINGVVAGHSLLVFILNEAGVTSFTVTDSSGTTWALSGSVFVTGYSESMALFVPTSAVTAGTHTITVTWIGGTVCRVYIFEDSSTNGIRATPVARDISSPSAGQTLTTGVTIGNNGDTVYMLADCGDGGSANSQPVVGSGGFTINWGGNLNANFGAWSIGYSNSAGGTIPSFATGTTGAGQVSAIIAIAIIAAGGGGPVVINPYRLYSNGQFFSQTFNEGGNALSGSIKMRMYSNGNTQIIQINEVTGVSRLFSNGMFNSNNFSER